MTELLFLLALLAVAASVLRSREQQARIALLGSYLGKYQIERQMEALTDGYLRWLGEEGAERRAQIRGVLAGTEQTLAAQFESFAKDVAGMPAPQAQVSKLAFWIPYAQQLLPRYRMFDVREAFAIHARGIAEVAANVRGLDEKAQAHQMTAELLLMQHTCHWFCRSRALADARLVMRHQTAHAQVLAAVSPQTARAYAALMAG
ncbi:hypothetical protein [Pseudorhodoferax sp. Leaf267]|uniref:hypothetical protein n=1 Tax=Pseudorhodoferax sp. Leaf267 TaxID=1736316 RepID=UPI0007007861|nr:hypothetical protein [Pseudorhodoferax sp. Leaf267]KQP14206.1 hypothetical protein ASF43_15385 [Pseudorhodoferax sp. Leaf267]